MNDVQKMRKENDEAGRILLCVMCASAQRTDPEWG